jgi:putative tricarboxylic transport membrane protein
MLRAVFSPRVLALLCIVALALAACGDEPDTEIAEEPDAEPEEEAVVEEEAEDEWEPPPSVEVVVHTGPGGGSDVFARALTEMMTEAEIVDTPWPVRNVEGGSGAAAMAHMMQEQGNDETIAAITMTWVATSLTTEGAVDLRELTPIAQVLTEPTFIAARVDAPFDDFDEMIAWSQDNPGELNLSGGSVTSHAALVAAAIQDETDTAWRFVSFPGGGERIAAVLGGDTDIMFGSVQDFEQHVRAGDMKWIATIEEERADFLPDVPTVLELGYDVIVLEQVRGFIGPPGMPPEVVAAYERLIDDLAATDAWQTYMEENGWISAFAGSQEWGDTLERLYGDLGALLEEVDIEEEEG